MSLPSSWTERIFDKLALTYGQRFLGLYAGLDLEAVKANWGHELRGYAQSPNALGYALDHLPEDRPPTVLEFRALCRRYQQTQAPVLEAPAAKPDPAMMARAAQSLQSAVSVYGKAWAVALRDRERRGGRLTLAQAQMWRDALGVAYSASADEAAQPGCGAGA